MQGVSRRCEERCVEHGSIQTKIFIKSRQDQERDSISTLCEEEIWLGIRKCHLIKFK